METVLLFITILAWAGIGLCGLTLIIRLRLDYKLNNTSQGRMFKFTKEMEGRNVSVPLFWPFIGFLVSACWLIARWIQ